MMDKKPVFPFQGGLRVHTKLSDQSSRAVLPRVGMTVPNYFSCGYRRESILTLPCEWGGIKMTI